VALSLRQKADANLTVTVGTSPHPFPSLLLPFFPFLQLEPTHKPTHPFLISPVPATATLPSNTKHRFEQVLSLPGHKASVWSLAVLPDSSFAVSVGQDRSIRFWHRGEDLVFVEEEKERYLESLADHHGASAAGVGEGEGEGAGAIGRVTTESVKGGELIMQALDLVEAELAAEDEHTQQAVLAGQSKASMSGGVGGKVPSSYKRKPNPLLLNLSPLEYFSSRLRLVPQPDLEQALLVLPFFYVRRLVTVLLRCLASGKAGDGPEIAARCAVFLVRCHFNAIVSTSSLVPEIKSLTALLRGVVGDERGVYGENLAALRFMRGAVLEKERGEVFVGDTASESTLVLGADAGAGDGSGSGSGSGGGKGKGERKKHSKKRKAGSKD